MQTDDRNLCVLPAGQVPNVSDLLRSGDREKKQRTVQSRQDFLVHQTCTGFDGGCSETNHFLELGNFGLGSWCM